jgi:hypothetical protein
MDKRQLDQDLYPMNQDRVDFDVLMYANSIDYIAGHIKRRGMGVEEAVAMIEKDVRMMLDQKFNPQ